MSEARIGAHHSHVHLPTERLLATDDKDTPALAGPGFSAHRASKTSRLIGECADLINRGGVAALVPASAADGYLDEVAQQVKRFAISRGAVEDAPDEGILALPTSGSTGAPKLVAIPAGGIARFMAWAGAHFGFGSSTVSLSLSPWNFDVSLLDTWAVLAANGTVVAADPDRLRDPDYLRRLLVEYRPTFIQTVPSTLDALANAAQDEGGPGSVTDVVLTGGVAARSSRHAAARQFPSATFHNVYGATEVNDCLVQKFSAQEFAQTDTLPLGSPITGCAIMLSASGALHPVLDQAKDAEGEVLVSTPWMARGYIADGALHPLPGVEVEGHGVLYPMKDHVSYTAGRLTYLGRNDRTIKVRGQRINLDEIEQAAHRTGLTGMAAAWVDESAPDSGLHLAYTAPDHAQQPTSGLEIRVRLSRFLSSFSMPNHLHSLDRFPLNGNGKPDLPMIKTNIERG